MELSLELKKVFETGRSVGYREAKEGERNPPRCTCPNWDEGRKLGFIRKNMLGFLLIGWRSKERLEEPEPGAVNESLFRFCPWCGCRARVCGAES